MEKYSNVIMQRNDREDFLNGLGVLNEAFNDYNLRTILNTSFICNDKKIKMLLDISGITKKEFENFLRVLLLNKKINLLPEIYKNLVRKISLAKGEYFATIFTMNQLSELEIKKYEEKLSSHFTKKIKLDNKLTRKEEIRIYLEDLGYEIIVSNDILKQKLKQYITKAM